MSTAIAERVQAVKTAALRLVVAAILKATRFLAAN